MKQLDKLQELLSEIEKHIPNFEVQNSKVSKSSIGWHLDHSLKVVNGILGVLEKNPNPDKKPLKLFGRLFLFFGFIPRGKGTAPKVVRPPEHILLVDIEKQLDEAKTKANQLHQIAESAIFTHPYFGSLSKKQSIRFVEVHTKHHLKIIDDILNKNPS